MLISLEDILESLFYSKLIHHSYYWSHEIKLNNGQD